MAIVVVAIHVQPFDGYAESTWIDIYRLICYCAVPFFFLCTGYFLAKGIGCAEVASALEQIKKLLQDNDIVVTELDMSKYKNNIIKIIGKDKKKSEHSFVTDLISFDNVIKVEQN